MLSLPRSVKIYLAKAPADMRKSIDGLTALVMTQGFDVYSGHLFVFLSKQRNRAKILTFDRGGFVVYYKRLESRRFGQPALSEGEHVNLDAAQLTMLLDGVDVSQVRRNRAWEPVVKNSIDMPSKL